MNTSNQTDPSTIQDLWIKRAYAYKQTYTVHECSMFGVCSIHSLGEEPGLVERPLLLELLKKVGLWELTPWMST